MKRILLFALLLFVFSAGYSQNQNTSTHNLALDYIVISLMSLGVGMLIIHVISARQSYKEEAKKEPPVSIINHFHVCGSTAHAGSTAVNDRSVRSYDNQEDNSSKSEVTNSNGGTLYNHMVQTPYSSDIQDYIEGADDESLHADSEEDENEEETTTEEQNRSSL